VPHAPRKSQICEVTNPPPTLMYLSKETAVKSCSGIYCWGTRTHSKSIRLLVRGVVRDPDCRPISGAEVDVFQPSPEGHYGSIHGDDNGNCRGVVTTNEKGEFQFETYKPGSYGALSGAFYFDIPPWIPVHIHIISWYRGYYPLITQLYFDNDPTVDYDFRAHLTNISLGADDQALRLKLIPCGDKQRPELFCATMDFVLAPASDNPVVSSFPDLTSAVYHTVCVAQPFNPGSPIPLCYPSVVPFLRQQLVATVLIATIIGVLYVFFKLAKCLCGRNTIDQTKKTT